MGSFRKKNVNGTLQERLNLHTQIPKEEGESGGNRLESEQDMVPGFKRRVQSEEGAVGRRER